MMDPERQPLLRPTSGERCRTFRPLTREEVLDTRQELTWRRARFFLVLMFWAIMAMFLSIIASLLVTAPSCSSFDSIGPSVPPVHMSFGPLVAPVTSSIRNMVEKQGGEKILELS